ncbi:MAG: glycosyltransferase WbuB [Anaerolineae bacterium]|nr:MAG: glycosyltransferase WbuB [Anaerolineae bacterium]
MHILLIHQAFAALDEPGGTRHYELARHLVRRGHRVTIIASPVSYITGHPSSLPSGSEENDAITILRAPTYHALHKSFVHRTLAFFSFMFSSFFIGLRVREVDLVWGTSPPIFQAWTAWLLARLKGVPFLFEVRDLWPYFAVAVGVLTNPVLIRMSEWLERFLYRGADRVMVNSPGFIAHVTGRGAKRVELVPNGADASMFDPSDEGAAFRRSHGLEGKFVVLYAGAHGMSNDLDVVLDAARLLEGEPHIQIVLLGDGKEKPRLVARAHEMGLTNVTFLPPLPKRRMPEALAAADACIAILKPLEAYKTTYPNKVFDYMAAGRPIVLAIDGVIRQVVEAADCGLFTPPGDPQAMARAIRQLAADSEVARAMGLRGRRYVEQHFHRADLAHRLAELLEAMVSQQSNNPTPARG